MSKINSSTSENVGLPKMHKSVGMLGKEMRHCTAKDPLKNQMQGGTPGLSPPNIKYGLFYEIYGRRATDKMYKRYHEVKLKKKIKM